ncbi:hypothetical protein P8631_18715, partial [Guyparkeria sp. 1SP6A2]|nr:hypothetical protein [Guyparkeria sp. 1SP6A2]
RRQSAKAHSRRSDCKSNKKCFDSTFHAVFSLFVDSQVTIAPGRNKNKRQIAEMEKAAKAAFVFCITLRKFASSHVITAAE